MVEDHDRDLEVEIEFKEAAFFNKRTPEQLLCILSASDAPAPDKKLCTNREHLIQFLAADFHAVCQAKGFLYICFETLRSLLLSPHLRCDHTEDAVRAVARWVRYDSENRKRFLDVLVPILPYDEKHPLRNKAAIVSNWDVYHHAHKHSTRHHHHSHHHHHHHNIRDPSTSASTITTSTQNEDIHHNNYHHSNHHHHIHSPFHFHLHRPHLHLPHLHRPHLPHFMHRSESKTKMVDMPVQYVEHISPRTVLGDRMIEKRTSVVHRDVQMPTST